MTGEQKQSVALKGRQTFTAMQSSEKGKERVNLEGRARSHALSLKAWSWLQDCGLKPNQVGLTAPPLVPSDGGIGGSTGETPVGESVPITGRYGGVPGTLRATKGVLHKPIRFG